MTGRLGHAALALGLAQLIGCAQGYDSSLDDEPPMAGGFSAGTGSGSTGAGRGGTTSQAGGMSMAGGGAGATYMGEPCERGETEECTCPGDMGKGIRTCRKDDLSPTMGTFSACESCVPDEEDPAGMGGGGTGQSGSGSAGRGGAGGSTSSAGSSSGSAGRTSGSAGRSGGSSGSSGGSNDPAWCFFVPVPLPGVCD